VSGCLRRRTSRRTPHGLWKAAPTLQTEPAGRAVAPDQDHATWKSLPCRGSRFRSRYGSGSRDSALNATGSGSGNPSQLNIPLARASAAPKPEGRGRARFDDPPAPAPDSRLPSRRPPSSRRAGTREEEGPRFTLGAISGGQTPEGEARREALRTRNDHGSSRPGRDRPRRSRTPTAYKASQARSRRSGGVS